VVESTAPTLFTEPAPGDALPRASGVRSVLGVVAWAALVVVGFAALISYESAPGRSGAPPESWPVASSLVRPAEGFVLVAFLHPRCPCSRTTVGELVRIASRSKSPLTVEAVFVRDRATEAGWERGDLWDAAGAIPGVHERVDVGGVEAARFGAKTSGHVLLYGPDGLLRFRGGVTAARGHAGDNPGETAILDSLEGRPSSLAWAAVFGCPLFDEACERGVP
jgi:hypothetical protein